MGFRKTVRKNIPKVDLQSYNTMICSGWKGGKTRMYKELIEWQYPDDPNAGLLLAFEPGYATWELDTVVPIHEYEGAEAWKFFTNEVVKDLVEEAKTGRVTKVIGIDTVDRYIDAATDFVLEKMNKKYGKPFASLQEVGNKTDENGWTLLYEEMKKPLDALKSAGYGFIWIAWTKERTTETIDGLKFTSLSLLMNATAQKVFASQADLIVTLFNEVKVLDKEGNELDENLKDKKGKDKASYFHETETYMYFRESSYIGIAGGRFVNLPEKAPYGIDNFIKVFEEAVKGQLKKTTATVDELKIQEVTQREEKAVEYVTQQEEKAANDPKELIAQLDGLVGKMADTQKQQLATKFKEIFKTTSNYKTVTNVEQLQQALELAKKL